MNTGIVEDRRGTEAGRGSATAAPHPEEMRATLDLKIGDSVAVTATARATPAGLVAVALVISAALIPLLLLYKARGARPSPQASYDRQPSRVR